MNTEGLDENEAKREGRSALYFIHQNTLKREETEINENYTSYQVVTEALSIITRR